MTADMGPLHCHLSDQTMITEEGIPDPYHHREKGKHMKKHGKKMIAPIVVTGLVIAWLLFYFGFLSVFVENIVLKWLLVIIPILLGGCMIGVCIQRIKEIKGGEEDDLGQY